mmetsp:Transcript_33802/g.93384  ORF Transcript_33802/g.93384 Transcript_33802/m.93384 type:complete len:228 (-) Transcript_33802:289-972(-)
MNLKVQDVERERLGRDHPPEETERALRDLLHFELVAARELGAAGGAGRGAQQTIQVQLPPLAPGPLCLAGPRRVSQAHRERCNSAATEAPLVAADLRQKLPCQAPQAFGHLRIRGERGLPKGVLDGAALRRPGRLDLRVVDAKAEAPHRSHSLVFELSQERLIACAVPARVRCDDELLQSLDAKLVAPLRRGEADPGNLLHWQSIGEQPSQSFGRRQEHCLLVRLPK